MSIEFRSDADGAPLAPSDVITCRIYMVAEIGEVPVSTVEEIFHFTEAEAAIRIPLLRLIVQKTQASATRLKEGLESASRRL